MSPTRRRDAVAFLVRRHKVSERRACKVFRQHRSTQRYVAVPGDFEHRLVKQMKQLANAHPRYGYRRVHALLVADGWDVNVKRVHRLWRLEQLKVPPRKAKAAEQGIDQPAPGGGRGCAQAPRTSGSPRPATATRPRAEAGRPAWS